ncbi:tmcB-like protein [Carpediemonas membranifera]|uniref:TmcB-like protein n=1 Tax=Carpediemonas membranifera TaxID=201153 RepID=A0A8J6E516_9EUKA|nr:tmcB-like protein [Carpediemonas membranifera]|eukprot:KAG9397631.1 tmcB-like protein [Carpediemonas membranifera]
MRSNGSDTEFSTSTLSDASSDADSLRAACSESENDHIVVETTPAPHMPTIPDHESHQESIMAAESPLDSAASPATTDSEDSVPINSSFANLRIDVPLIHHESDDDLPASSTGESNSDEAHTPDDDQRINRQQSGDSTLTDERLDGRSEVSAVSAATTTQSFFSGGDAVGMSGAFRRARMFAYEMVYLVVKGNRLVGPLMILLHFIEFLQLLSFAVDPCGREAVSQFGTSVVLNKYIAIILSVFRLMPNFGEYHTALYVACSIVTAALVIFLVLSIGLNRRLTSSNVPPLIFIRTMRVLLCMLVTILFVPVASAFTQVAVSLLSDSPSLIKIVLAVVVICILIAFTGVTAAVAALFIQPELAHPSPLGRISARSDVITLIIKAAVVCTYHVFDGTTAYYLPGIILIWCLGANTMCLTVSQPYFYRVTNILRVTMLGLVAVVAACFQAGLAMRLPPPAVDLALLLSSLATVLVSVALGLVIPVLYSIPTRLFVASNHAILDGQPAKLRRPTWILPHAVGLSMRPMYRQIERLDSTIQRLQRQQPMSIPGFESEDAEDDPAVEKLIVERNTVVDDCFRVFQHAFRQYPNSLVVCAAYFSMVTAYRPSCSSDCMRRSQRVKDLNASFESFDMMYFFFQAFRTTGRGGSNDEIARLERQRRLRETIRDQHNLMDDRAAFWKEIRQLRTRAVTSARVHQITEISSRMSVTIDRVNSNYNYLLRDATPRILRQYSSFLRDVMGLERSASRFMERADELEASTKGSSSVQVQDLDTRHAGYLFGAIHTGLEVRGLICCVELTTILGILSTSMYLVIRYIFQHMVMLFFTLAMFSYTLLYNTMGVTEYLSYNDPSRILGFYSMSETLLTAIRKTASIDYIENTFDLYSTAVQLITADSIIPQAHKAAILETHTPLSWSSDTWYPHALTELTIGLFSDHLDLLSSNMINVTSNISLTDSINVATDTFQRSGQEALHQLDEPASDSGSDTHDAIMSHYVTSEMSMDEAITSIMGALERIEAVNRAALIAQDGSYPVDHTEFEADMAFVLANTPALMDHFETILEDFLLTTHSFPFVLMFLLLALMVVFSLSTCLMVFILFINPVRKAYAANLEVLKALLMLPPSVMEELSSQETKAPQRKPKARIAKVMFNVPDQEDDDPTYTSTPATPRALTAQGMPKSGSTKATLAMWKRAKPHIVRRWLFGLLPRILLFTSLVLCAYDFFSGILIYRVIGDTHITSEFYIMLRGIIANGEIASQVQRVSAFEAATGMRANTTRASLLSAEADLEDAVTWMSSTTTAFSHNWFRTNIDVDWKEEIILYVAELVTSSAWVSGPYYDTIAEILYVPSCPFEAISPDLCVAMLGGLFDAPTQTQGGLLSAAQFATGVAKLASQIDTGFMTAVAQQFATIDTFGLSGYFVNMIAAIRNRLGSDIDSTVTIIIVFTVIIAALIAGMYVVFFRPLALKVYWERRELLVNLDIIVRDSKVELPQDVRALVERIRPQSAVEVDGSDSE